MAKEPKAKKTVAKIKAPAKKAPEKEVMPTVTEDGEIMTAAQAKSAWAKRKKD